MAGFKSALLIAAFVSVSTQALALDGKVTRVIDGDTIAVLTEGQHEQKVRLASIDAPEKTQAFGSKAKQYLSDLVFGKQVHVTEDDVDRYGRIVGLVTVDNESSANKQMVGAGLAWVYVRYLNDRDESFLLWQAHAKEDRLGVWSEDHPIPPWDFRKKKR